MYKIAALYHFVALQGLHELRREFRDHFMRHDICGTLLLAPEGINGTLAGSEADIAFILTLLTSRTGLTSQNIKFSLAKEKPFKRLKVRLKREIITFKHTVPHHPGDYVTPEDWNTLIADPEIVLIDTRNRYETELGSFVGARDPNIDSFSQFADYVRNQLDPMKHKKIAMFCTGGIRCEKASAFMRAEGFAKVYHLQGGILKYLEKIPAEQSKWEGECFVFDERIAVDHALSPKC